MKALPTTLSLVIPPKNSLNELVNNFVIIPKYCTSSTDAFSRPAYHFATTFNDLTFA